MTFRPDDPQPTNEMLSILKSIDHSLKYIIQMLEEEYQIELDYEEEHVNDDN